MNTNGKRTEPVGVAEGLDVGEEVGYNETTNGFMWDASIRIYLWIYNITNISTTHCTGGKFRRARCWRGGWLDREERCRIDTLWDASIQIYYEYICNKLQNSPNRSGLQKDSMLARRLAVNVEADVLYFMREIENKQLIKQLDNLLHL